MNTLVLASSNSGKLRELSAALADFNVQVKLQSEFTIPDADETGLSFIENALIKARHAARLSGFAALADDSGICVHALRGAPGIYSARYAGKHGDSEANNQLLLERMQGIEDRRCYFYCAIALVRHADDPTPIVVEGRWNGELLHAARGERGFGYDPLFWDVSLQQSAAELDLAVKHLHSHRGHAVRALKARMASFD
jgi:XTP/dITP diphosphohydrolase